MTELEDKLTTLRACYEAIEWASIQEGSFQESWDKCERPDWMLWLLRRSKANHKEFVLVNCKIVRSVLGYIPEEKRPLKTIQVTEAWVREEATSKEVEEAMLEAFHAAEHSDAYFRSTAYYVAYAAYDVARAAIAYHAGGAVYYVAEAKASITGSYSNEAKEESYINSAKVIREFFPDAPDF